MLSGEVKGCQVDVSNTTAFRRSWAVFVSSLVITFVSPCLMVWNSLSEIPSLRSLPLSAFGGSR